MMPPEATSPMDEPWIRQLLQQCGLPHEDITPEHLRHFWVMKEKGEIIGVVGLEVLGRLALLRSLAVAPRFRKRGLASQLTKKTEEYAASLKIEGLYLLTMTAEDFFLKRGYRKIERNSAPPEIRGTTEFQGLCPASSVCMVKQLTAGARDENYTDTETKSLLPSLYKREEFPSLEKRGEGRFGKKMSSQ